MTAAALTLCSHCLLPAGRLAMRRDIDGEKHAFCCYGCYLAWRVRSGRPEESEAAWLLIRLGVGGFLTMNLMLLTLLDYSRVLEGSDWRPYLHLLLFALATPAMVLLGGPLLRETAADLIRGRLGATALICLGSGGAYAASVASLASGGAQVYFDVAAALLMLFTLGRLLEALGRARAVRSLAPMLEAERQWAMTVGVNGEERRPVSGLQPGDLVRVHPGERIPVDGVVVDGQAWVDEALLTGESRLAEKAPGIAVCAGTINQDGVLLVRTTAAGTATRWAAICRAVHETLHDDTPLRRLADRVAAVFVPTVLVVAGLTAWQNSLLAGLAVLAVACPCALGLATPLVLSLAVGRLARHGCVVRGGRVLEVLAQIRVVAFDKTGTLTTATPRLTAVEVADATPETVLQRAAAVSGRSGHMLGRSILAAAAERGIAVPPASAVTVMPGYGASGLVAGERVAVGRLDWLTTSGWSVPAGLVERLPAGDGATLAHVGWSGRVRGVLAWEATLLPEAAGVVRQLHELGVGTVLATGDLPAAASTAAATLGISAWHARQSPEDKQAVIRRLKATPGPVAMVGDGINDGPVLAQADLGIAVGSASDLARESARLVLPEGGLHLLPWAIRLARRVNRLIILNLAWAFGYNLIAIALATLGLLQPVIAAGLMAASSAVVILISLQVERGLGRDGASKPRQATPFRPTPGHRPTRGA